MDCPSGNDQKSALRGYAPTAGVNEQAVFAIVAQESSFGDFDAVGNNVMQINDRGQSVEVRNLPDDIKAQIGRTDGTIRVVDIFSHRLLFLKETLLEVILIVIYSRISWAAC